MKRTVVKVIVVLVAVIFLFSAGFWTGFSIDFLKNLIFNKEGAIAQGGEEQQGIVENLSGSIIDRFSLKPLEEALDFIFNDYINQVSREELLAAAIKGMLSELDDRHAEYFNVEQYRQIVDSYSGTMSGVGIIVTEDEEDRIVVVMPVPDTPAFNAGIKEGDIIVEVDGNDIRNIALENVVSMIKGPEGTEVMLGLYRPSEEKQFEVTIVRTRFYVPNLFSEVLDENTGYIQYIAFQD
ncbi:MAG: PDZ domain-containing protein, partial [Actinobacteria bacterium]|nr:PDZ domain-containing protein [Actinomycetota bacterium]